MGGGADRRVRGNGTVRGVRGTRKGAGRAQRRRAELAAAATVDVPAACDVCVIGGGASGLAAAIAAAERGARVVVLERAPACGTTILATGNGRCNLANADLDAALRPGASASAAYHNAAFAAAAMGTAPTATLVRRFAKLGLDVVEDEGRLYPASRVAESVRAVLLGACTRMGVTLAAARGACGVTRASTGDASAGCAGGATRAQLRRTGAHGDLRGGVATDVAAGTIGCAQGGSAEADATLGMAGGACGGDLVVTYAEQWDGGGVRSLTCASLVVATGGPLTGGATPAGAGLAGALVTLGLASTNVRPMLTPLACTGVPATLDGRRAHAMVTLRRGGATVARESGEVLFRSYGLSGIVVLNLSRAAIAGDVIELDLVAARSAADLADRLRRLREAGIALDVALSGVVDPRIAAELARLGRAAAGNGCAACAWREAARIAKGWGFVVAGVADAAHAQVTRGGIDVACLDAATLAARSARARGIFCCGEAVDVDGPCGGFNLAWAWQSGTVAGTSAAQAAERGGG